MGNNSVPKFIFPFSRFPVYRGSVLGRFYCTMGEKEIKSNIQPFYCEFMLLTFYLMMRSVAHTTILALGLDLNNLFSILPYTEHIRSPPKRPNG